MYLTKLLLRDFGKFHNDELSLQQGINVIEGKPGTGKTTIAHFITGILYGIRRHPGEEEGQGEYDRLRPQGQSRYSGTGYLKQEERSYLIDRSFLQGERKFSVLDIQSGREVLLKDPDSLCGTLVETDRNTFRDSSVITDDGKDPSEEIISYLGNKLETGNGSLNKAKAIALLQKEKEKQDPRPLIRRLDKLSEELEAYDDVDDELAKNREAMRQLTDDFAIEAAKRKRVARQIVENEDGTVTYKADEELDRKIDRLTEAQKSYGAEKLEEDEDVEKKRPLSDNPFIIFLTGILVIGVITLAVYLLPFEDAVRKLFIIFTAVFVIVTILVGFRDKGYFTTGDVVSPSDEDFNRVLEELEEEKESREELEFDMTFAREYSEKKDKLKEEEKALLERKNQRDRLRKEQSQVFRKKSELEEEVSAIHLAIKTIEKLSVRYQEKAVKTFVPYLGEYISAFTGGAYAAILFDEQDGLVVEGYRGRTPVHSLSPKEARQVLLAIRLSISKHTVEEQLPLVIDDIMEFSSPEEVDVLLGVLRDMDREQIIIMTGNSFLRQMLEARQIPYNHVQLG